MGLILSEPSFKFVVYNYHFSEDVHFICFVVLFWWIKIVSRSIDFLIALAIICHCFELACKHYRCKIVIIKNLFDFNLLIRIAKISLKDFRMKVRPTVSLPFPAFTSQTTAFKSKMKIKELKSVHLAFILFFYADRKSS